MMMFTPHVYAPLLSQKKDRGDIWHKLAVFWINKAAYRRRRGDIAGAYDAVNEAKYCRHMMQSAIP